MATPSSIPLPLTGDNLIDAATHGFYWQLDGTRTIDWAVADGFFGEFWNSPQSVANTLTSVFNNIASYANINFNYVGYYADPVAAYTGGSDITISLGGSGLFGADTSTWAVGIFPYAPVEDGLTGEIIAGDIFLNINSAANFLPSYAPGSAGYALAIHEIGHTLGLKHPFDDGGTGHPTLAQLGVPELDKDWFTVMAYNDDYDYNLRFWDPATPMVMDVLALQYLYGKNNTTNATNTTHTLAQNGAYQTIWDAGGMDVVDVSQSSAGWQIDLPILQVSARVDTKVGAAIPAAEAFLVSPLTLYWLTGDIENVTGSSFDDVLRGNNFSNTLIGNAGNDYLDGGTGADWLIGGLGNDTYVVDNPGEAVTENADQGTDTVESSVTTALGPHLENLTLTGGAAINGTGNALGNVMTGNAGNNVLDGGAGNDTARYAEAAGAVTVSLLAAGAQDTGAAGSDTLVSIENLFGSLFNDTLTGDSGANVLSGGGGRDTLTGGSGDDTVNGNAGRDTLTAGTGTDTLHGGADFDTAVFGRDKSDYTIQRVAGTVEMSSVDGVSTLRSVEMLQFGDGSTQLLKSLAQGSGADFNGDGFGDILWRNDGGQAAIWLMNGSAVVGGDAVGPLVPTSWAIEATGDFDGDGRADILWHNELGESAIWLMNGTAVAGGAVLGHVVSTDWSVAGTGDFNADGREDVLWHNDMGQTAIWLIDGTDLIGGAVLGPTVPNDWSIAGTGDFNADGREDVLWHNDLGEAAIWLIDGTALVGGAVLGPTVPTDWSVAGTGDFNADGREDVLWHNELGQTAIWLIDGTALAGGAVLPDVPTDWGIGGTGDFNGDGREDILWRNEGTGQSGIWEMDGTAAIGGGALWPDVPSDWLLV